MSIHLVKNIFNYIIFVEKLLSIYNKRKYKIIIYENNLHRYNIYCDKLLLFQKIEKDDNKKTLSYVNTFRNIFV